MTAKEYLKQYRRLGSEIAFKEYEIRKLQEQLYMFPSSNKEVSVVGGGCQDRFFSLLSDIDEKERAIKDKLRLRKEIERIIKSVPDFYERLVLEYRYIAGAKYEEIAEALHYTTRYIYFLHEKALSEIKVPD